MNNTRCWRQFVVLLFFVSQHLINLRLKVKYESKIEGIVEVERGKLYFK